MAGDKKIVALQESLSGETEKFRALQKDLNKCLASAQQLEAQLKENEVVKEELGLVKDDSKIYKMIGPVLVKQVNLGCHGSVKVPVPSVLSYTSPIDVLLCPSSLQDLTEARANVDKRLQYIEGEVKRNDALLNDLKKKQVAQKDVIDWVQKQLMELSQKQAQPTAWSIRPCIWHLRNYHCLY